MKTTNCTVGALLREARARRGFTRETAAATAGISRDYWGVLEAGREFPKITTLISMRDSLELDASEWSALLACYLVEAGAVAEEEAGPVIRKAAASKSKEEARTAKLVNETSDWMLRLSPADRETFGRLPGFLERHPAFFEVLAGLMRVSCAPSSSRS